MYSNKAGHKIHQSSSQKELGSIHNHQSIQFKNNRTENTVQLKVQQMAQVAQMKKDKLAEFKKLGVPNKVLIHKLLQKLHLKKNRSVKHKGPVAQLKTWGPRYSPQEYRWKTSPNGQNRSTVVGKLMEVFLDPSNPLRGQSANLNKGQTPMMGAIKKYYKLDPHEAVKGHLLNDNVGGPALNVNLFPITKAANANHLRSVENDVKQRLWDKKQKTYYKVEVNGSSDMFNSVSSFNTTVGTWNETKNGPQGPFNVVHRNIVSDLKHGDKSNDDDHANFNNPFNSVPLNPATKVGELSQDERQLRDTDMSMNAMSQQDMIDMLDELYDEQHDEEAFYELKNIYDHMDNAQ